MTNISSREDSGDTYRNLAAVCLSALLGFAVSPLVPNECFPSEKKRTCLRRDMAQTIALIFTITVCTAGGSVAPIVDAYQMIWSMRINTM